MVNVQMDEDELLRILVDRVSFWTENEIVQNLYREMYANYLDNGCIDFSYGISYVVDNDYINYCTTVESDDKDYETILEAYNNGDYDISGLDLVETGANRIEAYDEYNKIFLVRY